MEIRQALPTDSAKLAETQKKSLAHPLHEQDFLNFATNPVFAVYVAEQDGTAAAHCVCTVIADEVEIISVATHPDYRRRGLAKALLLHLFETYQNHRFFLDVRVSNTPAKALYTSLGFTPAATRKNFYTDPTEDGISMIK